jgi:hypothetical protein
MSLKKCLIGGLTHDLGQVRVVAAPVLDLHRGLGGDIVRCHQTHPFATAIAMTKIFLVAEGQAAQDRIASEPKLEDQ